MKGEKMSAIERITKAAHLIDMNDIIREGNPTLRSVAEEVTFPLSDQEIILGEKMMQFLKHSQDPVMAEKMGLRGGVGLAAPQLDISKRIIAVLVPNIVEEGETPEEAYDLQAIMYNPKIVSHSVQDAALGEGEGCLSVDRNVPGYVVRHARVTVDYFDKDGEKHRIKLKGYNSIVVHSRIKKIPLQDGVLCYNRGMKTNDIVYGVHAVTEALLANTGNKLYLQEDLRGKNVEKVKELATEKKVSISWTSKKSLSEMTEGAVHQGFVLRVSEFAYSELDNILAKTRQEENPLLLILDGLTDPHNLGSILRTADATNVSGVIIPKHRAVGVTPVVAKTATGAIEHVPIARVTNLSQTLDKLKDEGFWTFGTDMNGTPCHKWNTKGKIALIIGNEGKGISSNIKKQVDEMITIPMNGHVQSLNASVAAAILMYEVFRNRL